MATLSGMVVDKTKPIYNYNWLCSMMQQRKRVNIVSASGSFIGLINGISPEDGSGNNWLVTITSEFGNNTIFVKAK